MKIHGCALIGLSFVAGCCILPEEGARTSFAEKEFAPYLASGEIPGVINVFQDGDRQEISCLGYADVDAGRKITLDDPFMQCSQTKGFCGVTMAILVEEERVNLDDPVSKYLPEFETLWVRQAESNGVLRLTRACNVLTVRMCLNHTGGFQFELPNFKAMGGWSRRMPLRSAAATAAAFPLDFEPGTGNQYSNVGIDVAAAIVEQVSGQRWEDFLHDRVLLPLGMTSSGFRPTEDQLLRKIELYRVKPGEKAKRVTEFEAMQRPYGDDRVFPSAAAGLWTTTRDQLKFYRMLMNLGRGDNGVRILREQTVRDVLMRAPELKGKESPNYSLGLIAPKVDGENQWVGHGGAWGSQCMVNWHKKQLQMIVLQIGGDTVKFRKVSNRAADGFFKAKLDHSDADAYTGRMK